MSNRVCEILGIEKPVLAAPMTWITNAEYVAAVSNAGGAGILGFNAGQTTLTKDPDETIERTRAQIRRTKELTTKPFGVNMMLSETIDPFTERTLKLFKEERPAFVAAVTAGKIHPDIINALKELDIRIVCRPISPTVQLLKDVEKLGVDIVVCVGFEAGGHSSAHHISLMSIFPAARRALKCPLMAAGGICDELSAKAVAAMGAEGAYVGTRFIVTKENPTHPLMKQAIIDTKAEDMFEVPSNPGHIRMTRNETGIEVEKMFKAGATGAEINDFYMGRGGFMAGMLKGDLKNGFINGSEAIDNITSIKTVKEVIDEIGPAFLE